MDPRTDGSRGPLPRETASAETEEPYNYTLHLHCLHCVRRDGSLSRSAGSCCFALSSRATKLQSRPLCPTPPGAAGFALAISAMSDGIGRSAGSPIAVSLRIWMDPD